MVNRTLRASKTAHKVFRDIAYELTNGKKVTVVLILDALAANKEATKKLVITYLAKNK